MVPFSCGQSRFLEAPLVWQADGEVKNQIKNDKSCLGLHQFNQFLICEIVESKEGNSRELISGGLKPFGTTVRPPHVPQVPNTCTGCQGVRGFWTHSKNVDPFFRKHTSATTPPLLQLSILSDVMIHADQNHSDTTVFDLLNRGAVRREQQRLFDSIKFDLHQLYIDFLVLHFCTRMATWTIDFDSITALQISKQVLLKFWEDNILFSLPDERSFLEPTLLKSICYH